MSDPLYEFYFLMFCFWIFVFQRNITFNIIRKILGESCVYKKSAKIDIGFSIIILSIVFGVIIYSINQFISIDIVLLIILMGVFSGGFVMASGLKKEWSDNR